MTLSNKSIHEIADAIKGEIIDHIYCNEIFIEMMQTVICQALESKMGKMDEDLFFDLGMVLIDKIELK